MSSFRPDHAANGGGDVQSGRPVDAPLLLALLTAFVVLAAVGAIVLSRVANPAGNPMAADRAVFASLNAITLTGFELAPTAARDLEPAGRCVLAVLTLAGALFTQIAGASLISSLLNLGYSRLKIAGYAVGITALVMLLGAGFLMQPGQSLSASLAMSLSGFANSGLCFTEPWGISDWRLHGVLLPLSLLGGLGLPVLIDFAEGIAFGKPLSPWSRRMITLSAVAYFCGFGLMLLMQWNMEQPFRQWVASASAMSVNTRSLGVSIVESPLRWPAVAWGAMLLMLLGAAPGGMAGGLRLTTLASILGGTRKLLRGQAAPRELGAALLWLGCYLAVIMVVLLSLLANEGAMSADRLAFIAVSAVGNVGLSHDPMSLTGTGLNLVSLGMLAGRMAPLFCGCWMASRRLREVVVA